MNRWFRRLMIVLLCVSALIPGLACKRGSDSEGGGGGAVTGPLGVPINVVAPGTADDEQFDGDPGFAVGADGIARLAWLATGAGLDLVLGTADDTTVIRYARRRADGTWTAPIVLSTTANVMDPPQLEVVGVGPNAGTSFVFWTETDLGLVGHVHVARVSAGNPPTILTPDAEISDGPLPVGIIGINFVALTITMSVESDAMNGDVVAIWGQTFDGDAGGAAVPDECAIAGVYFAGGPGGIGPDPAEPDAKIGLTVNNLDAGAAAFDSFAEPSLRLIWSPLPAVGAGGTMHAFYVITAADGTGRDLRWRRRTGAAAFTPAAPGVALTSPPAPAFVRFLRPAVDAEGDLYVTWGADAVLPVTVIHHSRAAVGTDFLAAGSTIVTATPGGVGSPDDLFDLAIALDGSTPVIAYKLQGGVLDNQVAASVGTPDAGGPFPLEVTLHPITTTTAVEGGGRIAVARETGGRIVFVFDAPPAAGAEFDLFGVVRPTGGPFAPEVNLTGTAAISRLVGSAALGDMARFAWLEGPDAGPRDVFDIHYASGVFGAPVNLSMSPATDSHGGENGTGFNAGNVGVAPAAGGIFHVWYREHLGAAQHDPFHISR